VFPEHLENHQYQHRLWFLADPEFLVFPEHLGCLDPVFLEDPGDLEDPEHLGY
jgi:hypothetical protein